MQFRPLSHESQRSRRELSEQRFERGDHDLRLMLACKEREKCGGS